MMKRITMSRLGCHGRWGNQIHQYMGLHTFAANHNLEVQTARWAGEDIFQIEPSPITEKLSNWYEPLHKTGEPKGIPGDEAINRDWHGYFQYHTSYLKPHEKMLRKMFTLRKNAHQPQLAAAATRLFGMGYNRVGLQIRVGDYGRLIHYLTPVQWYLNWLQVIWPLLDDPVLFIAAEDRSLVDAFSDYNPQTAESLGVKMTTERIEHYSYQQYDKDHPLPHTMQFMGDWFLLTQCHYLAIPNSTFSFTSAMFSTCLKHCWRSHLPTQGFRLIDPWNTTPMEYAVAEDYKHIEGVCLEENEQW